MNAQAQHQQPRASTDTGTLLAFDVGTRRIGVAVGERGPGTAHGIDVVRVHRAGVDWQHIERLVTQWEPRAFVVGVPFDGEGGETSMSAIARRFGAALGKRFARPVHWVDERLTSDAAEAMLRMAGTRIRSEGRRDRIAAQLILETFLNAGGMQQ